MSNLRAQAIKDIIELGNTNSDKANILAASKELGDSSYKSLAQDVADHIGFKWNRMTRDDPKFNEYQDRLHQLVRWVR